MPISWFPMRRVGEMSFPSFGFCRNNFACLGKEMFRLKGMIFVQCQCPPQGSFRLWRNWRHDVKRWIHVQQPVCNLGALSWWFTFAYVRGQDCSESSGLQTLNSVVLWNPDPHTSFSNIFSSHAGSLIPSIQYVSRIQNCVLVLSRFPQIVHWAKSRPQSRPLLSQFLTVTACFQTWDSGTILLSCELQRSFI